MFSDFDTVVALWARLGERERRVVKRFVERLYEGQKLYGTLTKDKKNWRKETQEEALDASGYLCAQLEDTDEDR